MILNFVLNLIDHVPDGLEDQHQKKSDMSFAHENLHVYQRLLSFVGAEEERLRALPRKHAFVDHAWRAGESALGNLVEGVRLRGRKGKLRAADYAVGSALEVAACLDIAKTKGLFSESDVATSKGELVEIVSMLIGLRKSWEAGHVAETSPNYGISPGEARHFHHEELEAYQLSLSFWCWFAASESGSGLEDPIARRADKSATSMTLNVAEGNGRFSELDQDRFLNTANASTVKLAMYLDLGMNQEVWERDEIAEQKGVLRKIAALTAKQC